MNELNSMMDAISDNIRRLEGQWSQIPFEFNSKNLSWKEGEKRRFRIFFKDRPLIEHPFKVRMELFNELPQLIKAKEKVVSDTIKTLKKLTK